MSIFAIVSVKGHLSSSIVFLQDASPSQLPVLEEGLQGFTDGVSLLDGEEVLELLTEGPAMYTDAGRKDLCDPLQGAEHRSAGARRHLHLIDFRHGEGRWPILNHQTGHCSTALQQGHHLLMRTTPGKTHTNMNTITMNKYF